MFPLFATIFIVIGGKFNAGIFDTGGKFSTGNNDTSGIGGKFTAGVVDTDGKFVNISMKFRKIQNNPKCYFQELGGR